MRISVLSCNVAKVWYETIGVGMGFIGKISDCWARNADASIKPKNKWAPDKYSSSDEFKNIKFVPCDTKIQELQQQVSTSEFNIELKKFFLDKERPIKVVIQTTGTNMADYRSLLKCVQASKDVMSCNRCVEIVRKSLFEMRISNYAIHDKSEN